MFFQVKLANRMIPKNSPYFCSFPLSSFNKLYFLQNKLDPLVLEWCPTSSSFYSCGKTSTKYWPNYFIIYLICFAIGTGSCGLIIMNPTKLSDINVVVRVAATFLTCLGIKIMLSLTIFITHLDEIICGFYNLKFLVQNLNTSLEEYLADQDKYIRVFYGPKFWRNVAKLLIMCEPGLISYFLMLTPIVIYMELDPFVITFPLIFPRLCQATWFLICARLICGYICIVEACRFVTLYVCMMVSYMELEFRCLHKLGQIPAGNYEKFITWYNAYQIAHNSFHGSISNLLGLFMGCVFFVCIVCNVGTIRFYGKLPLVVYCVLPLVTLACSVVSYLLLPFAVRIGDCSHKVIERHKVNLTKGKCIGYDARRILRKRLACLKTTSMCCGNFYPLRRGSEAAYFFYVLLRTVDALLTSEQ